MLGASGGLSAKLTRASPTTWRMKGAEGRLEAALASVSPIGLIFQPDTRIACGSRSGGRKRN